MASHFFRVSALVPLLCLALIAPASVKAAEDPSPSSGQVTRAITDMRGKSVVVPTWPKRVATIDDGFVEAVMTHLGVIDSVAMIGSWSMKRDYVYDFEAEGGGTYRYRGWNTMKYLHPWLDDLPCVNSPQGNVISYETLAAGDPDVIILRIGDCTVGSGNAEAVQKTIATLEALGIPLVVLYAPSYYKSADLSTMRDEARVIGALYGMEDKAAALLDYCAETEKMIRERTADLAGIPDSEKVRVLYMGLNPDVRKQGGAGSVHGVDTPESYIIETIAGARNAFSGKGAGIPLSAEQIYALDPDVVVLPTSNGYHPPRELYDAPYYANLRELRAVREHRVYAMPWSPMNCSRRLEYPIDLLIIAKAAYPERFADVSVYEFALDFYKHAYHVDDEQARALRSHQLLDWMKDTGF